MSIYSLLVILIAYSTSSTNTSPQLDSGWILCDVSHKAIFRTGSLQLPKNNGINSMAYIIKVLIVLAVFYDVPYI